MTSLVARSTVYSCSQSWVENTSMTDCIVYIQSINSDKNLSQSPFTKAEFLDEIQTKVQGFSSSLCTVTFTALHLDLYFFKLTQPLTISPVQLQRTVKEKGGKPDRKPYPLPYGLRNPYRNLKSENSQDYAQKPQKKLYFHEFDFGPIFLDDKILLWCLNSFLVHGYTSDISMKYTVYSTCVCMIRLCQFVVS